MVIARQQIAKGFERLTFEPLRQLLRVPGY
jgi:hypothetical protein